MAAKRTQLMNHDVLLMDRRIRDLSADGWTEKLVDVCTGDMVEALLATWPVPDGLTGTVTGGAPIAGSDAYVKDLVAAGLLLPGTVLHAPGGKWSTVGCTVLANGDLEVDGKTFTSPSAAGQRVRRGATNGWSSGSYLTTDVSKMFERSTTP